VQIWLLAALYHFVQLGHHVLQLVVGVPQHDCVIAHRAPAVDQMVDAVLPALVREGKGLRPLLLFVCVLGHGLNGVTLGLVGGLALLASLLSGVHLALDH